MSQDTDYNTKKQLYLREQIIHQNYNADDFTHFIEAKREDGIHRFN